MAHTPSTLLSRSMGLVLALTILVGFSPIPSQAATIRFVDARPFFWTKIPASDSPTGYARDLMGYYASSDTIRLFSEYTIRQIFRNDSGASRGYYNDSVVADPSDSNIVYFTTYLAGSAPGENGVFRLNKYNFKTKWHSIITTKSMPMNPTNLGQPTSYRIVMADGSKLVFIGVTDNSPGPCANGWTSFGFYQFDLRSPNAGFTTYNVPQSLINKGEAESKACEVQMESTAQ